MSRKPGQADHSRTLRVKDVENLNGKEDVQSGEEMIYYISREQ